MSIPVYELTEYYVYCLLQAERKDILSALLRRMYFHESETLDVDLIR